SQILDAVSHELTLVLGIDACFVGFDRIPHPLIKFRTDQNFAATRAVAVTRSPIDGITNDGVLHPLVCTNQTMNDFTTVNANAKFASALIASSTPRIYFPHRLLHLLRGLYAVKVLLLVDVWTAEHSQNRVSDKLIYRSLMPENYRHQVAKIIFQHLCDFRRAHGGREVSETPHVGQQDRNVAEITAQPHRPALFQSLSDLRRHQLEHVVENFHLLLTFVV